jgi:hypothetical protein
MGSIHGATKLSNWEEGKIWSDRFLPEIKMILGLHLIGAAPTEEDCERNTDLIVLKLEAVRIACRIRRNVYYEQYPNDITIRAGLPSGAKTELTKIIEGWGDYFFYGFSNEMESGLIAWKLCKLNAFRLWFNRHIAGHKGELPGKLQHNKDGSSTFLAFNPVAIPNFIIAKSNGG